MKSDPFDQNWNSRRKTQGNNVRGAFQTAHFLTVPFPFFFHLIFWLISIKEVTTAKQFARSFGRGFTPDPPPDATLWLNLEWNPQPANFSHHSLEAQHVSWLSTDRFLLNDEIIFLLLKSDHVLQPSSLILCLEEKLYLYRLYF